MSKQTKGINYLFLFCFLLLPALLYSQESHNSTTYEKSSPLSYTGKNDFVIDGLDISATNSYCIVLWGCKNVIIKNCKFTTAPNIRAVYLEGCTNVTVKHCYFDNVYEGVMAGSCKGDIKVEYNDFLNIRGQLDGGSYFADAVQFNNCTGPGNSISYNSIENIPGESAPEDVINLFHSSGTAESPIMVKGNWLRGGGPNPSGGGILIGDWGGSYQIAEDNILVNPGQYGMGIGGGHDMILRNNKIYAKQQSFTNVGLSIHNWTIEQTGPSYNILVENNDINWINRTGKVNTSHFQQHMRDAFPGWEKAGIRNPNIFKDILPDEILIRTKMKAPKTTIYADRFNRVSIKCFDYPVPEAVATIYDSAGKEVASEKLSRFRTLIDKVLDKDQYEVNVFYVKSGREVTQTITIK